MKVEANGICLVGPDGQIDKQALNSFIRRVSKTTQKPPAENDIPPDILEPMKKAASRARVALARGDGERYRCHVAEVAALAGEIGARVVRRRDLAGMVLGLKWPDRPRAIVYLA